MVDGYSWAEDFVRPLRDGKRPPENLAEFFSDTLDVRNASGSGRGVFATHEFAVGEPLFVEAACFEEHADQDIGAAIVASWSRLGADKQRRWSMLAASGNQQLQKLQGAVPLPEWAFQSGKCIEPAPSSDWLRDTLRLNGYSRVDLVGNPSGIRHIGHLDGEGQGGLSLFAVAGIMNHSCYPTVEKVAFPGWLVTRAARELGVGTELTHSYIDVRQPLPFRRRQLREGWGFVCRCHRCLLEEEVWADSKLQSEAAVVWQTYHMMIEQKKGGLQQMMLLLQEATRVSDKALEQYLVREVAEDNASDSTSWRKQFAPAFDLTARQSRALLNGQDPGKAANPDAVTAFKRLRSIVLASYWLSPAMQFAQGLLHCGRFDQCSGLLAAINEVLQEVLPCSSLHVASVCQGAVCAIDAARPESECAVLLAQAARLTADAYGDGVSTLEILLQPRLAQKTDGSAVLRRLLDDLQVANRVEAPQDAIGSCGIATFMDAPQADHGTCSADGHFSGVVGGKEFDPSIDDPVGSMRADAANVNKQAVDLDGLD